MSSGRMGRRGLVALWMWGVALCALAPTSEAFAGERRGAIGEAVRALLGRGAEEPSSRVRAGVYRTRVRADDGMMLALYRFVPAGGGLRSPPVLLVPDLGLNRQVYALGDVGLAPWLQARGREVYVLELRGHGASDQPKDGWHLSEIVKRDLPAVVRAIRGHRTEPIDLVVHGYAGALAIAAAEFELHQEIGRVVALSTPALVEVPNRYAERVLSKGGRFGALALDPEGAAILELLFARHGEFPSRRYADLRATAFSDLGPRAAEELLQWMRTGDLALGDGSTVRQRLTAYERPTLQILSLRNNWVHPEHASPLREVAVRAKVQVRMLSLLQYLAEDYTHLSMLQGTHAREDVFPLIEAFLDAAPQAPSPRVVEVKP